MRTEQAEVKVEAEKKILETVDQSTQKGQEAWQNLQQQTPDRIREAILDRIKSVGSLRIVPSKLAILQLKPRSFAKLKLIRGSCKHFRPL